jgi:uncharacterized protein YneF (UPF0154 family)
METGSVEEYLSLGLFIARSLIGFWIGCLWIYRRINEKGLKKSD